MNTQYTVLTSLRWYGLAASRWQGWQDWQGWRVLWVALMLLGLLLAFHQVARVGLRQGELRHQAMAVDAAAMGRCNNLQSRELSEECLVQARVDVRQSLLQFQNFPWAQAVGF